MRPVVSAGVVSLAAVSILVHGALLSQPEGPEQAEEEIGRRLSERQRRILDLFSASRKSFLEDGRVSLHYQFEDMTENLVADWSPNLKKTRSRIRWSRGLEGTYSTVEHGIIISDTGTWIQKARFLPDIEVTVEILSVAPWRKGTILAPMFYNPKKKAALGSNDGNQIVALKGTRLAKPPHPRGWQTITPAVRRKIGFKYDGKVLEAKYNRGKRADSSGLPEFTRGFEKVSGHAGIAWKGSVQCFLFGVTIVGRLDPDWVAARLGETKKKGGKKKKR